MAGHVDSFVDVAMKQRAVQSESARSLAAHLRPTLSRVAKQHDLTSVRIDESDQHARFGNALSVIKN